MNKTIFMLLIFATLTSAALAGNKTDADFEMMMLTPDTPPMFFMDGPMMPRRPAFNIERNFSQLDLTDEQRDKLRKLGKKHHKEIKQLGDARAALHEQYQEKFEAVLTDEQFRKIEKMRKDLRHDMKKLNDKQHDLFEQHRSDFESILTDTQRQQLFQMHIDKK